MKIVIFGGAGFIGSYVSEMLVARGHDVHVVVRQSTALINLEQISTKITIVRGDFLQSQDVAKTLAGADVLVHLAWTTIPRTSNTDPVLDAESNILGSLRLIRAAHEAGVRRIVFGSSGGTIYGQPNSLPIQEAHATNPICSYGISKLAIEKYLHLYRHLYGLDCVCLRLANPYGPRQSSSGEQGAIAVFLAKTIRGLPIQIWGDGSIRRDFFFVEDAAAAFVKAVEADAHSSIYNIGSGAGLTLLALLEAIEDAAGRKPTVQFLPRRALDVQSNFLDIELAKRELGWMASISLRDGLQKTVRWYRSIG